MNNEINALETNDRNRIRRAWFIFGFLAVIGVGVNFVRMLTVGEVLPFVVTIVGVSVVFLLVYLGWTEFAGGLFVALLYGRSMMFGFTIANVMFPLAIIVGTVGVVIIQSVFRPQHRGRALSVIGVTSLLLITLDFFFPWARSSPDSATIAFLSAVGTAALVLLIYFLIKDFQSYSLRYKFIFSISLFAIFSLAATTYFVSRNTSKILLEEAGGEFQSAAAFNASVIADAILRDGALMETLSNEPLIADFARNQSGIVDGRDPEIIQNLEAIWNNPQTDEERETVEKEINWLKISPAAGVLQRYQSVILRGSHDVILTDKSGRIIAAPERPNSIYVGDTDWFQQISSGEHRPYISNVYAHPADGHIELLYAVPIIDPRTGEFIGSVAAHNDLVTLLQLFETTNTLGTNAIMGIIFTENRELTVEDGRLVFKDIALSEDLLSDLRANGFGLGDFFGEPNLISYVEIEGENDTGVLDTLDWAVIIHQDERIALEAVTTQQRTQLLIGLLVVTVGVISAIVVAQIVAAPLQELQEAAARMAQGDYTVRAPVQSGDEIASVALAFNNMAAEIEDSVRNLESRIHERTQTINTSYRISRSLATLIRKSDLIRTVVEELTTNFEYDQVQIYMLDTTNQVLELADASGEIGKQLLEQKFSVPVGHGLIGRAAESQASILSSDVSTDPHYVPNPILDETRAELAIPIVIGQTTLGVIDIQEHSIGRLNNRDIELVESIAGQLAISLRNAEFYEEAEAQARREATINHIRQRILQTQNVEDALKIAARELAQATKGKVVVRLGPDEEKPANGHD